MNLDPNIRAELEAGVNQSRLAHLAQLSPSTLRGYAKDGLVPTQSHDGKKTYGLDALEALEAIKHLRAEGLSLRDISARMKLEPGLSLTLGTDTLAPSSAAETTAPQSSAAGATAAQSGAAGTTAAQSGAAGTTAATEAELRAQVEQLRAQLQAERAKLERLSNQVETRVIQRRNELVLTKRELEELERLRESNIKRALAVTRRTKALQYATTRPGVIRLGQKKPTK
jgi:DNA-binding transcriptional MerR regulator